MWRMGNLAVGQGEKVKGYLQFPNVEETLPVFLLQGQQPGPRVLILGGIHGCEYTSIDAALQLGKVLEPADICGSLAVLPIANPASFYARSIYVHPADGKNLNRMFPGKADGSAAERLAFYVNEEVFQQVDYVIDLHGGDMIEALVPFTIYHQTAAVETVEQSKELASLFGISYVVASKGEVPGSTYGCAAAQGKPAVIAEAGQQGILSPAHSQQLQKGTRNALRRIGMLPGEVERGPVQVLDVFDWYRTDIRALWYPAVAAGDEVEEGCVVGTLQTEFGEVVQEITARTNGVVLFLMTSLAVNPHDPLLAIGR